MAKWAGIIGYSNQVETSPGIWEEVLIKKHYVGDLVRNTRSLTNDNQINDGVSISNQISFISDPYARENFHLIRYATFMGQKWKVTSADIEYPRIVISLGGIYNA